MKTIRILLLSAASLIILAGCSKSNSSSADAATEVTDLASESENQTVEQQTILQFTTIAKKDTFFFNDTHNHYIAFDLELTYPISYKNGNLVQLQQQLIASALGNDYKTQNPSEVLQNFWTTTSSEYAGDEELMADVANYDAGESMVAVTYAILRSNLILRLDDNLLHYKDERYDYTGGAHGSASTTYHIIDLRSGKPVLYKDIFKADATAAITKLIVADYLKQREWKALDEDHPAKAFAAPNNIKIEDTGLTFHYGYYEISSYPEGEWDIFLPYSQLLPYMKPDSPLYEIAGKQAKK
jgi:hypothetical protein